ncbi:hypothetical protein BKH42_05820 [Helicobacter sp. 13S00482-2]|uniref:hypothetical protein n=1 Tax=Helicobacter sp. 13S00482-2 TaxID=1476200 RepID=UPI000BA5656B|nr:hypothetical protein [Helicobacter sp. 13S00482-2]PAF53440.1 hypothetical protein BKH42_05820 [Helicobacter sp. 13S00482-2]
MAMKDRYNEKFGVPTIIYRAMGVRKFNPGAESVRKARDADRKLSHVLNDPKATKNQKEDVLKEYKRVMKKLPFSRIF